MKSDHAVDAREVCRTYRLPGGDSVIALDNVTFSASSGGLTAITGPVGSGKTTLLEVLAGLERADSGRILIDGSEITSMGDTSVAQFRRSRLGFIFGDRNLLPDLTARDNILLPLRLDGRPVEETRLAELAARLGVESRLGHRPGELSAGEQQLVAVARALLPRPDFVFADEPTAVLDPDASRDLLELFADLASGVGTTVVLTTHDAQVIDRADRVHRLEAGELTADVFSSPTAAGPVASPDAGKPVGVRS